MTVAQGTRNIGIAYGSASVPIALRCSPGVEGAAKHFQHHVNRYPNYAYPALALTEADLENARLVAGKKFD